MKWKKYSIETTPAAEEAICGLLYSLGISSLEIEDNIIDQEALEKAGGDYDELRPDMPSDESAARVIFYLEEADENNLRLDKLHHALEDLSNEMDIGAATISVSISDENDWRDNWKEFFHPFSIGDLLIKPSWEDAPEALEASSVIEIDPGLSFGTGHHETTRMCIEELQQHIEPQDKILDIGFGSGILSIAALKLGAGFVCGTDIDSECLSSVKANFKLNDLDEALGKFYIGDLTDDDALAASVGEGVYDIVTANILADIIIAMRGRIFAALRPGGILITSGIIDRRENDVLSALTACGFTIIDTNHLGEWSSITAKRDFV